MVEVDSEGVIFIEKEGMNIGALYPWNREAHARFIITAWNSHDRLVDALDALRAYCIPGMNWTDEVGQAVLNLADKALAAAKEAPE